MQALINVVFSPSFFYSILRVTTPILFASLGMVVANTAGIPNIALEGIMLISAFVGMMSSALTGSAWLGLLFAVAASVAAAGILAFFTLYYRANVILGGIAINSLASGGTVFALYLFCHDKGTSASVQSGVLPQVDLPLIKEIPVLGEVLSGHNILTYVSLLAVIVVFFLLRRTPLGFHLRAVGEDENAAESVGIHVTRVKAIALLISGLLAGLGGAFMSMGYVSWFSRDMVAGRGWIAIAAEAMGRSSPVGTALTSLLFGAADAFSNAAGVLGWPSDLVRTIPYCVTLVGLVLFSLRYFRRSRPHVAAKKSRKQEEAKSE